MGLSQGVPDGPMMQVEGDPADDCFSPKSSWLMTLREKHLLLTYLRNPSRPTVIVLPDNGTGHESTVSIQYAKWDHQEHWLVILGTDGSGWLFESQAGGVPPSRLF